MSRIDLRSFPRDIDNDILVRGLRALGVSFIEDQRGFEFAGSQEQLLAVESFVTAKNMAAFDERWQYFHPSFKMMPVDLRHANLARPQLLELLRAGRFGDFIWPLEDVEGSLDFQRAQHHFTLKEYILPTFFETYPEGRVLLVRYARPFASYLSGVHLLRRMQLVGADRGALIARMGRNSMGKFGLSHPAEVLHHALFLAFAVFYPRVHGFVASLTHQEFLVFLLPQSFHCPAQEPALFLQLQPGLTNMFAFSPKPRFDTRGPYPSDCSYQFDRYEHFAVDTMENYVRDFVVKLDDCFRWIMDLRNYGEKRAGNCVDLDFAWLSYLTLYTIIVRGIADRALVTMFERKMAFFDYADLHCGLIAAKPNEAMAAFKTIISADFANGALKEALSRYPEPFAQIFCTATSEVRRANREAVEAGILFGQNARGVLVEGDQLSINEFEARLLRALRNTKHGFAIRDGAIIAQHEGSIHNDLPDYGLSLTLGLLADHSIYKLRR